MMSFSLKRIKILINASSLTEGDKEDLLDVFKNESEEDLEPIAEFLTEDPRWVIQLSDNLKARTPAHSTINLDEIYRKEESKLDGL